MRKTLKQLQDRRATIKQQMEALLNAATGENGTLSAEQDTQYTALEADLTAVKAALAREERLQQEERDMKAGVTLVTDLHDRAGDKPWANFGEQINAIVAAGMPHGVRLGGIEGGVVDPRLYGSATGGSASVGADGGFLIRKDYSAELFKEAFEVGQLTSRCDTTPIGATSDGLEVVYIDETSRATGSRWGGVQVYRAAEAETVTGTHKPKLGKWECRLEDMLGIAYLTERLIADGGAMVDVYRKGFIEEFSFMADDEIYRGTGAGQCLGLMNHIWNSTLGIGSVVQVAKETGQLADTILAENIDKMWAKVLPRSKANGVWLINSECTPQLNQMQIGTGASGALVYMPPGGLSGLPYGTIKGRPVIEIEHASALGDAGDITYADLKQYKLITKGGIEEAESMHVRFLYNERAFRWVSRFNGAPKLKAAITPYKGASGSKLSHFVTLAARA
jgi:HK97 family phage major capsid protein